MPELSAQPYRLEPWIDLQPHLDGLEVISLSLGPDAALYVLAIVPPADYREQRGGASFAKITAGKPNTFVVLRCDAYAAHRVEIANQSWDFHHVQPLPDDELLLVCAQPLPWSGRLRPQRACLQSRRQPGAQLFAGRWYPGHADHEGRAHLDELFR